MSRGRILAQRKSLAHDLFQPIERVGRADVEDGVNVLGRDPRDDLLEFYPLRLVIHPLDDIAAEPPVADAPSIILNRVRWS